MKKIFAIAAVAIGFYLSSCKKQELPEVQKPPTTLQSNVEGELIDWNSLPEEYKNTGLTKPVWNDPVDFVSARSNHAQDQVFKAFANITGTAFNIPRPPNGVVIDRIYIGHGGSAVTYLTIWYKRPDGSVYSYGTGGSGGQLVQRVFAADEYIKSISGTSTSKLTSLTIRTNKSSIGAGTVNGISFSYAATIGSYIGSFSGGYSSSSINQLNAISYFKPWEEVAGVKANDIAIDTDGTAYITGADGKLYKMRSTATTWSLVAGAPAQLTRVAAKNGKIVVVTNSGSIHQIISNSWTTISYNNAKDVTVDGQGFVFKVATTGYLYKYAQANSTWNQMVATYAKKIAAGDKIVRIVHDNGNIYQVSTPLTSMPGSAGRDIAMAGDNVTWLTNWDGQMYVLQYPNTTWKEIAGSDGNNIAAIPGKAMLVNTVGKVYRMVY
jgi:hypothetical protein